MELLYGKQNKPPKLIHCTSAEILLILLVQVVKFRAGNFFFHCMKRSLNPHSKLLLSSFGLISCKGKFGPDENYCKYGVYVNMTTLYQPHVIYKPFIDIL